MVTRGERNYNPLNIRRTGDYWLGMNIRQTDPSFCQFTDLKFGIRAAIKIILRYINHYRCDTIRKIITRWAPATENPTEKYIAYVSYRAGLGPDEVLTGKDVGFICAIITAMAFYESRMTISPSTIQTWWSEFFPFN